MNCMRLFYRENFKNTISRILPTSSSISNSLPRGLPNGHAHRPVIIDRKRDYDSYSRMLIRCQANERSLRGPPKHGIFDEKPRGCRTYPASGIPENVSMPLANCLFWPSFYSPCKMLHRGETETLQQNNKAFPIEPSTSRSRECRRHGR